MALPMLYLIILVAFFILSFIFRKIFKWFFYISLAITLLLAILAYLVYLDAANLKQFPDKTNLILMDDSGNITLAGLVNINQKLIQPLSEEEAASINEKYQLKDYEAIKHTYFLVMIFDKAYVLSSADMNSSEQKDAAVALDNPKQDANTRFQAFISLTSSSFSSQNLVSSVVNAFKTNKLKVYPETIIFKLIKLIPIEPVLNLISTK